MATTNIKQTSMSEKKNEAKEANIILSNPGEASVKKDAAPTVKKLPGKYGLVVVTY